MNTRFEGKTVDDALERAAAALGVDKAALKHEVVQEKTDDFWGLGEKVVVVRAWVPGAEPAAPTPTAPAPAPKPAAPEQTPTAGGDLPEFFRAAPPAAPLAPARPGVSTHAPAAAPAPPPAAPMAATPATPAVEPGEITAEADALLARVFAAMGFDCRGEARMEGESLHVVISGEDNAFLLEERGRGLSALELVLNHALRHRTDQGRLRIRVDAEDFRSQREDELRDLALQLAHEAKETGVEQSTEPLNSYERRLIHLALADDPGVTTRSLGQGFSKAVSIIPTQGAGRRR